MTGEPTPMSPKTRQALERELADLQADRDRIAPTLTDTDAARDTGDQADELQRASDLSRLDARIDTLTQRLNDSSTQVSPPEGAIDLGSIVTLRFSDGAVETIEISEVVEELSHTLITTDSPLGHALLGHGVGDTIQYETPNGHETVVVVSLGAPSDQD